MNINFGRRSPKMLLLLCKNTITLWKLNITQWANIR